MEQIARSTQRTNESAQRDYAMSQATAAVAMLSNPHGMDALFDDDDDEETRKAFRDRVRKKARSDLQDYAENTGRPPRGVKEC